MEFADARDEHQQSSVFDPYVLRAFAEGWTSGLEGGGELARYQLELMGYAPKAAEVLCRALRRDLIERWLQSQRVARPRPAPAYRKEPIPPELRWAVFERDDFTCQGCGARRYLTADHIVPESRGGPTTMENLQTFCRSCNSRKGAALPS